MLVRAGRSDAYVTTFIFVVFVAVIVVFVLVQRAVTPQPPTSQPAAPVPVAAEARTSAEAPASAESELAGEEGFIGVVLPRDAVDVAAEIEGRLTEICCQLGDSVRKDQVIALLDDAEIWQEIVIAAEVQHRLQVELERAEVVLIEAQSFYEREEDLFEVEPRQTSKTAYERAQRVRDVAKKDRQIALVNLAEQDARIWQLRQRHDKTTVAAPFEGAVATRYRDPGSVVAPGAPIVRLISIDSLVRFAVPEQVAGKLRVGITHVRVSPDAHVPIETLFGAVAHIAPEVDTASGMVVVEADVQIPEDARERIRSGMAVRVLINNGASTQPN